MIYAEYKEVQNYDYFEYCDYLNNKYRDRSKSGLFRHHYYEYRKANLSNSEVAKQATEEEKNTIIYCNFLEHLFLHILIGEQTDSRLALGLGGAVNYIIPQINKYLDFGTVDYSPKYYENIDKDVFQLLCERCNQCVGKTKIALEHNNQLYLEVEQTLNNKSKALVVLGTGLGKTTTALQYLWNNKCRALVIGPNKLIKSGWEEYSDWVDTTTYQSFANRYLSIDYSKYGLVILDEAHHAGFDEKVGKGAEVWSKGIKYLIDNNVVKVLGLTATPNRSDNVDIGNVLFEDCVCEGYAVEDGIEKGLIYPFDYITALYNTEELVEEYRDCDNRELVGQLDLALQQSLTLKDIFYKYMPTDVKRKGIIFIQDINDEQYVKDTMSDCYPNIEYRAIHSKMNKDEVTRNREWFENTDEGYLLAVNMISEGAHYDGVNTIIMFRKTSSYLVYTQQLGRIITLTKNENPNAIVFDLVNNIDSIEYSNRDNEDKRYQVSRIVRALEKSPLQKSKQVIIADESRDIVKAIREIKQFENDSWEDWEIEILKDNYGSNCIKDCVNLINNAWGYNKRTYGGTKRQAHKLNLQLRHQHIFTEEEIEVIKQSKSVQDAANKLNLSYSSVYNISKKFNMEFDNKVTLWSDEEIEILKTCKTIEEAMIKINRPKGSIITHASSLGISLAKEDYFWTDEMIQLLKNCNSLEDAKNKFVNKSIGSIQSAADRYNIKLSTYKNPIWSSEQETILQTCHTLKEAIEKTGFGRSNVLKKLKELDFKFTPITQTHKDRKTILCVETGEVGPATFFIESGIISKGRLYEALRTNKPSCGYHWKYVEEDAK